jgi:hypothetical protein
MLERLSMLVSLLVLDSVLDLERMLIELKLPILARLLSSGERGDSARFKSPLRGAAAVPPASLPSLTASGLPFSGPGCSCGPLPPPSLCRLIMSVL